MRLHRRPRDQDGVRKTSKEARLRRRLVKRVIAGLAVICLALAAFMYDGVRRERRELTAVLEQFTGEVEVLKEGTTSLAPTKQMELKSKDVVITGASSTATIIFPDGSGIILEPKTRFVVRLLEFARGGRRDRSFMVESGSVVSRVSKFFGVDSRQTICTPTAVTAVRGTGYRVAYRPLSRTTLLEVAEGKVEFECGADAAICYAGESVRSIGHRVAPVGAVSATALARLRSQLRRLERHDLPPAFVQGPEYRVLSIFDPALQPAGVARGGRDPEALDAARRAACKASLERLRSWIEAIPAGSIPDHINPWTLEELGLDDAERDLILDGFAGRLLGSFEKRGDGFVITATARDRNATRFSVAGSLAADSAPDEAGPSKPPSSSAPAKEEAARDEQLRGKKRAAHTARRGRGGGSSASAKKGGSPPGAEESPTGADTRPGIKAVGSRVGTAPQSPEMPELLSSAPLGVEGNPNVRVAGLTEQIQGPPTVPLNPPVITPPLAAPPSGPVIVSAPPLEGGGIGGLAGAAGVLVAAGAAAASAAQQSGDHNPPPPVVPEPSGMAVIVAGLGAGGSGVLCLLMRRRR